MAAVTQQNAALVAQAAAAESMEEQTRALTEAVSIFRLNAEANDALARLEQDQRGAAQTLLLAGPEASV